MGESQSRYSICERLTLMKLEILDDKLQLVKDIENEKQDLITKEKEFDGWTKTVQEDMEREKKVKELELSKLQAKIDFLNSSKKDKEDAFDLKIQEIDKALVRIEIISKSANE